MSDKNIDDLLMSASLPTPAVEKVAEPVMADPVEDNIQHEDPAITNEVPKQTESVEKPHEEAISSDADTDDYGNPVAKAKTYTEEEVQRMIRDRLARGRHTEQAPTPQQSQQINQDSQGFTPDPDSGEPWEAQLERFIDKTIEKKNTKAQKEAWERQEHETQLKFQEKFSTGMSKYQDFHEVVAGKPITDAMMLAIRDMDNPAAFIYAASKMQPKELEKIASIRDPYQQARALGSLESSMRKARSAVSSAPKAVQPVKGDLPGQNKNASRNIDQLIALDAKKRMRG